MEKLIFPKLHLLTACVLDPVCASLNGVRFYLLMVLLTWQMIG